MVLSSTATKPILAPASIAILQSVMRPSTDKSRMAEPPNSIQKPVPPAVPICPMIYKAKSLAETQSLHLPETSMSMVLDFFAVMHCVAIACSTSEVPMPCAKAPTAPCVEVCESPQTTVIPGKVAPCSGPITCTMPCPKSLNGK